MKYMDRISPYLEPPGCLSECLLHPTNKNRCIELALFQEHRFAFFYWLKWTNELKGIVPSLITYDWHQDLCPPYEDEIEELRGLDTNNTSEVALYTWGRLSHTNDVHIQAALMHNKIKNVYVLCRQKTKRKNRLTIKDFSGTKHTVLIFDDCNEFAQHILNLKNESVYFDLDLDYFTLSNPLSLGGPFKQNKYTYMPKADIIKLMSPTNPIMSWILANIVGFTIATEPQFCGGLQKSNYLLNIVDKLLFNPSLFHNIPGSSDDYTQWRHLKQSK